MPIYRSIVSRSFLFALLTASALYSFGCSGKGPDVVDPDADERNETALLAVDKGGKGEIAHYYEVDGLVSQAEYQSANGDELTAPIDAIYEAYENLYLASNATGEILVLDIETRRKQAVITGLPSGDSGAMCGMAFSNLSQGWAIAYGSRNIYHIDIRNYLLVRTIPLPGNPTAIATIDNRVFIAMENANGTGAMGIMRSNDPDFNVEIKWQFPRPPFYAEVNSDGEFLIVLVPGAEVDDPNTNEIDTDPRFFVIDLFDNSIAFELPFFSSSLHDYVGRHPNYVDLSKDSYLYLATPEGVKRIDTKSWGVIADFLPDKAYSVVATDYWTDLVYAVPADSPNTVERKTKKEQILSPFTLDSPVRSIRFVSTSKVGGP